LRKIGQGTLPTVLYGAKTMNMISTGAFLTEMDASNKQSTLVNKLVSAWEKKNSKTARAGGVSLMALSLAACGSSDDTSDAVSYTQAQLDAAKLAATTAAEATAATAATAAAAAAATAATAAAAAAATAQAAAVAAVDKSTDDAAAILAAVVAVDPTATTIAEVKSNAEATASSSGKALTVSADTLVGTASDESFSGQMDGTAAQNTAGLLDSIDGGAGTDTVTIINTTTNNYDTAAPTLTNVENFVYMSSGGGNLDFDDAGSATNFTLKKTFTTTDFSDVRTSDTVTFDDAQSTMDSTFTYNAASVANLADSHTITFKGVEAGADIVFVGAVETMTLNVTADSSFADLEFAATTTAINVTAAADLTVATTLTNAGVTTWTVTGAGDVDLNGAAGAALGAAVTTYNASGSTGSHEVIVGATTTTVTTAGGADDVDFGANLTTADTIDLGAGEDTLRVDLDSLVAGTADHTISNVETLRLADTDANAGALNMDNLAFTTVRFDADAAGDNTGTITLTDIATTTTAFTFVGTGSANDNLFFNAATIDYDTTTTQTAATLTFSNGGLDADDILVNKIDMDRMETINVNGTDLGQAAADELTMSEIEGEHFTDLIVTVDGELIISNVDGAVVDTIDLTGSDGGSAVTVSDSATAVTVNLGDGADTFTQNDTAGALTLNAGAGADIITGASAAVDTLTLGGGNDIVISNDFDNEDIVSDFAVGSDTYRIDLSVFETANEIGTHNATIDLVDGNAASVTSGNFLTFTEVSADTTIGAGDQLMVIVGANYTNATALTAIETGAAEFTTGTALEDDDAVLVLYSDGTDWSLAALHNVAGGDATADITASETALVDLVTFSGLGTLDAGDYQATMFNLIA
jgi:hypothetical protein